MRIYENRNIYICIKVKKYNEIYACFNVGIYGVYIYTRKSNFKYI